MSTPPFSVTEWSTPPRYSSMDDIENASRAGYDGIGLWEGKFGDTSDEQVLDALGRADLKPTFCLPQTWTILPVPFGPASIEQDPMVRTEQICESIPRMAKFDPVALMIGPGTSGDPDKPVGPVEAVADGLAQVADVAAEHGLHVTFELLAERRGSPLPTLPGIVDFIDEVGRNNVGVFFDIFHSWSEPDLHDRLRKYADRITGVHVCDIRYEERSAFDREMPGRGRGVATSIIRTLLESGYAGWWELEVFSDDGSFGNEFPDSYWKLPMQEFLAQGRESFERCYAEASEARPSTGTN